MKYFIQLQQCRKCIMLFMAGVICSSFALIIYLIDPVKAIVTYQLTMAPNTYIFNLWEKPPIGILMKIYIFNITNSAAFLSGAENLKIKEIGPYVYEEAVENNDVVWNDNGTVSYMPKRTVSFRPDLSIGDPDLNYVSVPNVPMLGVSSNLHDSSFFVNFPFIQLANVLNSQPILNITVHDYLWGYDDSLVKLAGTVVPKFIDFQKFGVLDRMYNEGENLVNMNIKGNNDMVEELGRYLSIESINGNKGLSQWGYVKEVGNETRPENCKCNRVQGATEAVVFPTNIDKRAVFRVFRKAFCRPLPIVFKQELVNSGLPGYEYTFPEDFADPANPENKCYCLNDVCLKKGLFDLTPCYYQIPVAASLPHFLRSDPSLSNGIEGLQPDEEKHKTTIVIQPTIGIPTYVHSRMQTNLVMQKTYYNSKIKSFNNMVVPLIWSDLTIERLPSDLLLMIAFAINVAPAIQTVAVIILGLVGATTVCYALARTVLVVQQQQEEAVMAAASAIRHRARRDSAELRIPLGYEQYTTIRILPALKKITSRSELFS